MDRNAMAEQWLEYLRRAVGRRKDAEDVVSRALALAWHSYITASEERRNDPAYGWQTWVANALRSVRARPWRDLPGVREGKGPRRCPVAMGTAMSYSVGDHVQTLAGPGEQPVETCIARETLARLEQCEGEPGAVLVHAKAAGLTHREIVASGVLTHRQVDRLMRRLADVPV